MRLGLTLHPDRGADAVLAEARLADEQGYDSVWLFDHLMGFRGTQVPNEPLDSFTIMTAIGAQTSHVRLGWATLNPSFRNPAMLAKMLATLDVITHGRVIASLGAGWFEEEYRAYDLPFQEDHADRIAHEREVIQLLKELWTHPAPERTTFEGRFVRATNLPFSPAPVQQPHLPIWVGGDSEDTLALVRDLADGWFMLKSGNPETLKKVLGAPEWPTRPMSIARTAQVFVAATPEAARAEAERAFADGEAGLAASLEALFQTAIVGTPEYVISRLEEMGAWGITFVRLNIANTAQQTYIAETIIPVVHQRDKATLAAV